MTDENATQGLIDEWYTPESDKDKAAPAQFKLRPMTGPEVMHCLGITNVWDRWTEAFKISVQNWQGVGHPDDRDKPLEFGRGNIDLMWPKYLQQVGAQALHISSLRFDDEKNS